MEADLLANLQQQVTQQMQLIVELTNKLENVRPTPQPQIDWNLMQFYNGMSTPPPSQFSFKGIDWPAWITRFEQYRDTTKLKALPQETQVKSLLYTMGNKANDIFQSFKLSEDDAKTYNMVKNKFDCYYVARKTKTYARARFNQRTQGPEETADDFITDLHTLAKQCEYGALEDELIRDRIVAGMKDTQLSKLIQNLDSEPSLEVVINKVAAC